MSFFEKIKEMFLPVTLETTLDREMYKAKNDLLKAEELSELYTALTCVYRARISRLEMHMESQVGVNTSQKKAIALSRVG